MNTRSVGTVFGITWAILQSLSSFGAAQEADEEAIRHILAAESQAYTNRDLEGSVSPYAKDVVVFDIVPPMQHAGIEANRQTNRVLLEKSTGPITVTFSNIKVVADHDHAYAAYFVYVNAALRDGRRIDLHARNLDVFEKISGRWLIILEESSVPVDMVSGKADFSGSEVMRPSVSDVP
jgi:ketosteroid isomerase-like protein